jgi:putative polyketide hydroxylase
LGSVVESPGTSVARAGSMAHHVLVYTTSHQKQGEKGPVPLADLLGNSFVLLVGHEGTGWVTASRALGTKEESWMPELAIHQLARDAGNGRFYKKYAILPSGCVLIRPDGFVAWSEHDAGTSNSEAKLKGVLRQILCFAVPMIGLARL